MKGLFGFLFLLMPVILFAGWLWLTWLLWKGGRRFLGSAFASRTVRIAVVVVVAALWFCGAFWEVAGKKMYWDAKVRELCAKDGGVKVYETVELPAEMFNKWGQIEFYSPTQGENALGQEYVFKEDTQYYRQDNPQMSRIHYQVLRRADGKLLGETTLYLRIGGDLPGPWHHSSFDCPDANKAGDVTLISHIFIPSQGVEK